MEILDYFKAIGRRFWVLILLPAVAGFLPLAYFVLRPAQFAARATIAPTALLGGEGTSSQYQGDDAEKRFARDVMAAITTKQLVDQIAAETKVPASRVRGGLKVEQVNDSAFLEFVYTTGRKAEAVPVVRTAAADTLQFLFQSQVDLARAQVDAAQKQVNKAENDLEALSRSIGGQTPEVAFATQSKGLASQQALAARTKDPAAAARIQQDIEARKADLASLAAKQGDYLALADTRRRAINLREVSEEMERSASAQLSAAEPGRAMTVGAAHRSFPWRQMLEVSIGAAAVALFLAVGYVFVSEIWDGARRKANRPAFVTS